MIRSFSICQTLGYNNSPQSKLQADGAKVDQEVEVHEYFSRQNVKSAKKRTVGQQSCDLLADFHCPCFESQDAFSALEWSRNFLGSSKRICCVRTISISIVFLGLDLREKTKLLPNPCFFDANRPIP